MPSQKIIWTVLPKGIQDGVPKLSVLMSPRLTPGSSPGQLGEFPDFWNPSKGHWPGIVSNRTFVIQFDMGGGSIVETKMAGDGSVVPDPKLWEAAFKKTTTVKAHEFQDLSKRFIHSYPVNTVVGYIRDIYRTIAEGAPTTFPKLHITKDDSPLPTLQGLLDTVGRVANSERWQRKPWDPTRYVQEKGPRALNPANFSTYGFSSKEEFAFAGVNRFYDRPHPGNAYREQPDPALVGVRKRLPVPKPDFHEMLGALGDYPGLMRLLGVVRDFAVPLDGAVTMATVLGAHAVRVRPASGGEYSPWTLLIKDFVAKPRGTGDISGGLLRVDNQDLYELVQVDVDAIGLKTLQFAGAMSNVVAASMTTAPRVNYTMPETASLPTVRTSGMAIARNSRAYRLAQQLINASQLNTALVGGTDSFLYADDLVRGYRVDVGDAGGTWRSLCERVGEYRFLDISKSVTLRDEGYVKGTSATSTDDGTPTDADLYVHENMFQWDGWSLSVSRPGRTIVPVTYDNTGKPLVHQEEKVEKPKNTAATELKMEVELQPVPGTLPRLRYGAEYRMRARVVDLAGNSIPLDAPTSWKDAEPYWIALPEEKHTTQPLIYGRFEPVATPTLIPRTAYGEGESMERMVIRSKEGTTADAYGSLDYVAAALAGKWYVYAGKNDRHVAPPKTAQIAAEFHGLFDGAVGKGKPHESAYNIAVKEVGTFLDTKIVDTATGQATIPVVGIKLVTPPATAKPHAVLPGTPVGADQYELQPGGSLAAGQYVVHDVDAIELPYLPDPFARGVALRGLPNVNATGSIAGGLEKVKIAPGFDEVALKVPFDGTWPDIKPFRVQLLEGTGEPEWKSGERLLLVPVPKGRWARVLFSSYMGKDPSSSRPDVQLMGLSQWTTNPGTKLAPFAETGSHWMLTPQRILELVHAVQFPLKDPKFYKSEVRKWKIGDTFVDMFGFFDFDAPSTGKMEVLAEWFDPIDSLTADKPEDVPGAPGSETFNRNGSVLVTNIDEDAPDLLAIHSNDVGLYYSQAGLKGFPGVELPAVQDGADAKLDVMDAKKMSEISAAKPSLATSPMLSEESIKALKPGLLYDVKKKDEKKLYPPEYAPHCRHEFNDTKHRFVDYHIVGTTRFREYFPTAIVSDPKNITRSGPAWKHVNILSSARPDAPKILYVVPTFGWEEKKIGDQIVSRRCGNAVRVYLERPWYSSGIGELLGVVLRSSSFTLSGGGKSSGNDPLKPFVTDLGMDPMWGSEFTKPSLTINDFPLATHGRGGLTLDELPGAVVSVAGHPVDFDPVRKLWYCDIEIDTGHSYFPFVRMGLARYQPDSIPDAHLSRVVLTDFAQLAPDRVAAVVFDPKDEKKVHVLVSGVYGTSALFKSMVPGTSGNEYLLGSTNDKAKLTAQGASRVVQVAVETKLPGAGPDAPWVPMTGAGAEKTSAVLTPMQKVDHTMVWGGEITLPDAPRKPGGRQYRLVVTESEVIAVDGMPVNFGSGQMLQRGMRLVYADTIELK